MRSHERTGARRSSSCRSRTRCSVRRRPRRGCSSARTFDAPWPTRHDLDLALIPAETINDDGLFLDEERFIAVREALPMPVFPSYDFIDVLALEGEPVLSGRHAA